MSFKKRFEQIELKSKGDETPKKTTILQKFKRKLELTDEVKKENLKSEMKKINDDLEKQLAAKNKARELMSIRTAQEKQEKALKEKRLDEIIKKKVIEEKIKNARSKIFRGSMGVIAFLLYVYFFYLRR